MVFLVDSLARAPSGELRIFELLLKGLFENNPRQQIICISFDPAGSNSIIELPVNTEWIKLPTGKENLASHDQNSPSFLFEARLNLGRILYLRSLFTHQPELLKAKLVMGLGIYRSVLLSLSLPNSKNRLICYEHTDANSIGKLWSLLRFFALYRSKHIVEVNPILRSQVPRSLQDKLSIIENPAHAYFDLEKLPRPRSDKPEVLLSIGRLFHLKRLDLLLQSFAILQISRPSLELWIVGDGPLELELKNLAKHIGISEKVKFLGRGSKLEELYSQARLFVMTSESESSGMVLLESMLCGTPVVSTPNAGARHIVRDQIEGALSPSWNPKDIANTVESLLTQPDKLQKMREEVKKVKDRFPLSRFNQSWTHLLSRLR